MSFKPGCDLKKLALTLRDDAGDQEGAKGILTLLNLELDLNDCLLY